MLVNSQMMPVSYFSRIVIAAESAKDRIKSVVSNAISRLPSGQERRELLDAFKNAIVLKAHLVAEKATQVFHFVTRGVFVPQPTNQEDLSTYILVGADSSQAVNDSYEENTQTNL